MPNSNSKQDNLIRQKPKWRHLPTKAVRLPEVFIDELLDIAEKLDLGELPLLESNKESDLESIYKQLQNASLESLLKVKSELPLIIEEKEKEEKQKDKEYMRNAFDREFQTLLNSGSASGVSILFLIERNLLRFNLHNSYSPPSILNEAYIRGIKLIEAGKKINKPIPWVRATTYNIIRELSRKQRRSIEFKENIQPLQDSVFKNNEGDDERTEEFARMKLALDKLEPEERELLMLKIVENLSWKQITQHLNSQDKKDKNEMTLRKRKERVLKRLHRIYDDLESHNV